MPWSWFSECWGFFFLIFIFYWRLITLQYCSGFCHTLTWISHGCTCVPSSWTPLAHISPLLPSIPLECATALALHGLLHPSNLHWSTILHMVTYIFQCYSLKSSHPRLLPHSPKVCSLHLCLFCCLAYRTIVTIFLNSIYMCSYTAFVFLFQNYFTLYNRLQFHPLH